MLPFLRKVFRTSRMPEAHRSHEERIIDAMKGKPTMLPWQVAQLVDLHEYQVLAALNNLQEQGRVHWEGPGWRIT